MRNRVVFGGTTAFLMLILSGPLGCSGHTSHDHDHPHDHDHDHASHSHPDDSAAPVAGSYADAIQQMRTHMTSLDAIIKSGNYDAVHKDSVAISKLCDLIGGSGGLAATNGSVPKDKLSEVSDSAKQLSEASRSLHHAAHAGDINQVRADYARMRELVDSLARYSQSR